MGKITLEELKKDKEALEEKFRLYEEQQNEKDSYELEYPKDMENKKYFYVRTPGHIDTDGWIDHEYDRGRYELGNFFKTIEEAELKIKRRKFMTRFNQFRDKCNGDWKPDFKKAGYKFYIRNEENSNLQIGWHIYNNYYPKFGYFKNHQDCVKAIELFGNEIKELF